MPKKTKIVFSGSESLSSDVEIVERKGRGHPDTLADSVAATASYDYSEYCLKKFGVIPHHRFDKTMVIGGRSVVAFGQGNMIKPIRLIYNGKVSDFFGDQKIPWKEILTESARSHFRKVLPNLDQKWLEIEFDLSSSSRNPYWFRPRNIYDIPDAVNPKANDTSIAVGYWPLSEVEELVLKMEEFFYIKDLPKFEYLGQDIKILAIRNKNKIEVTLCVPFLGQRTPSINFYNQKKNELNAQLLKFAEKTTGGKFKASIEINSEDYIYKKKDKEKQKGHYLLVSGTALDHGEEGVVGRGNKASGIISSFRPFCMEAPCGKNPAYYSGVIYAYAANFLSREISTMLNQKIGLIIISRNGYPIDMPYQILVKANKSVDKKIIKRLLEHKFQNTNWTNEILTNRPFIY